MKRSLFLALYTTLIVVGAYAQQEIDANKILKNDKLGKQLVSAVNTGKVDKVSEALSKHPSITSYAIALDIALKRNFTDATNLILRTNIAKAMTSHGETALMMASYYGLNAAISELVRNGASIDHQMDVRTSTMSTNLTKEAGNNALSYAILNDQYESVRILLEAGASVAKNVYYQVADVYYAGTASNPLYRNANDYGAVEAKMATILELAERSKNPKIVGLIESAILKTPGCKDDGPATDSHIEWPAGWAFDATRNLYFTDNATRIRKMDTNGIISTVAGNNKEGYSGDGGPAKEAQLDYPMSLAFDAAGNLFIADSHNSRIRKIDTNGIISTIAGSGKGGYGGDGGPAKDSQLNRPESLAFDAAGNLFIADQYNYRIRKIDTNGIISTIAGNGHSNSSGDGGSATNASLNPDDIVVDSAGNLFIADSYSHLIRKIDINGIISTIAGGGKTGYSGDGGPAKDALLSFPDGLAFDAAGNLFIADRYNYRIRKIDTNGIISTIAGNGEEGSSGDGGPAKDAQLQRLSGLAFDPAGNLFMAAEHIRKIDIKGIISFVAGDSNETRYCRILYNSKKRIEERNAGKVVK